MKKYFSIFLLTLLVFCLLTSCNCKNDDEQDSSTNGSYTENETINNQIANDVKHFTEKGFTSYVSTDNLSSPEKQFGVEEGSLLAIISAIMIDKPETTDIDEGIVTSVFYFKNNKTALVALANVKDTVEYIIHDNVLTYNDTYNVINY